MPSCPLAPLVTSKNGSLPLPAGTWAGVVTVPTTDPFKNSWPLLVVAVAGTAATMVAAATASAASVRRIANPPLLGITTLPPDHTHRPYDSLTSDLTTAFRESSGSATLSFAFEQV